MNNNLNLINEIGKNYNLTAEQFNLLTSKYQNDTREQTIIVRELNNICDFFNIHRFF